MPIYAYRCTSCGHAQDVLQKMSDPVLTVCPACGASTYAKQLTAAGFQLKGSGWYVTDFKGGNTAAPKAADGEAAKAADDKPAAPSADKATDAGAAKPADKVAAPAAAPAPAPPPATPSSGS
ncbi:MAG: zinc ribbon domain-containing protein [Rubrivivax sp.]|nr:zinc ribbon domain-containing protein [Rubrivivax sp.]MDP3612324.1 zinc ribbon domain-containing protein [Rubrivivax sp.]